MSVMNTTIRGDGVKSVMSVTKRECIMRHVLKCYSVVTLKIRFVAVLLNSVELRPEAFLMHLFGHTSWSRELLGGMCVLIHACSFTEYPL